MSDRNNKYQKIKHCLPQQSFQFGYATGATVALQVMLELARRGFALQAWSRRMKVVNCTALTTPKPIARRCFLARHYGITG